MFDKDRDAIAIRKFASWMWWRFSGRRVLHNPLRVLVILVSVGLATTLWGAVTRVSAASVRSFEQSLGLDSKNFQVFLSPVGGRLSLAHVSPCLKAVAHSVDILGIRRESGVLNIGDLAHSVSVIGLSAFTHNPADAALRTDVEVAPTLARELGIRPGARIELSVANRTLVQNFVRRAEEPLYQARADVVVSLESLGQPAFVDVVAFRRNSATPEQLAADLRPWLLSCLGDVLPVRIETLQAPIERSEKLLAAYRLNILIMSAITVLVCALLVSQATRLSLPGVLRELAILRTLGISRERCFLLVVSETTVLSCVGAIVGYTLGYPLVAWLTGFLLETASEIYHLDLATERVRSLVMQGITVTACMGLLGALSAAIGARDVLTLAPYRGTRREQVHNAPLSQSGALRLAFHATLIGLGVCAILYLHQTVVLAYASIAMVLLWVACVAPVLLVKVSSSALPWIPGVSSQLARGSLVSSGRQFVVSVVAGCIAIALMTGLSLMVESFRGTLSQWSTMRLSGDLFISSVIDTTANDGRIDQQSWRAVSQLPGVARAIPYFETSSSASGRDVVVGGVDLAAQCARGVYPFLRGGCQSGSNAWKQQAIVSESASRKLRFKVGDTFQLDGRIFAVSGVVQEFGTEQPLVVINQDDFLELYPGHNPKSITIDLVDRGDIAAVRQRLEGIMPHTMIVRDHEQLLGLVRDIFDRTFRVTESVRWIVFCIAMLGIVSTSMQHLWERRRDFKTASVMGVPRSALARAVALESLVCVAVALIVGLAGGGLIGWCLTAYINPLVFGWSLVFSLSKDPFVEALLFSTLVVFVTFICAHAALRLVARRVKLADE